MSKSHAFTFGLIGVAALGSLDVLPGVAAAHEAAGAETGVLGAGSGNQSTGDIAATTYGDPGPISGRWHGSVLLFDQSVTTQTFGVGGDYQSYDPTYEWWIAFKPRYYLLERRADAVSLNLWLNLYLELTDSDTTTRYREPLLGPTYLWANYGHAFRDVRGYTTGVTIGPRITLPTDKAAIDSGYILGLGLIGGVSQTFPLAGRRARALRGARLALAAIYNHPFARSTSPVNSDLDQLRQDLGFGPLVSDVLRPGMNVDHSLSVTCSAEVQVLPRLSVSVSYVLLNSWRYAPPGAAVSLETGPAMPVAIAGSTTTYGASTWTTASIDYEATNELSINVGYYNLANELGPSGLRRDPAWSPDARFFLTLIGNLDAIYQRLRVPTNNRHSALDPPSTAGNSL